MPVKPLETVVVADNADEIRCDGGGALGHPAVWYSFDGAGRVTCGYCDRAFIKGGLQPEKSARS